MGEQGCRLECQNTDTALITTARRDQNWRYSFSPKALNSMRVVQVVAFLTDVGSGSVTCSPSPCPFTARAFFRHPGYHKSCILGSTFELLASYR